MKFQRSLFLFFLISVIVISRFLVHSYDIHKRNLKTSGWVNHSNEVIKTIEQIYGIILEIESNSRAYVITGERSFADSCYRASAAVNKKIAVVQTLTTDNPVQQKNIDTLLKLVNQKSLYSFRMIALKDSSRQAAIGLMSGGYGRQLMAKIKTVADVILAEENRLLVSRIEENNKIESHSFQFSLLGGICSLILVLFFVYRLNRDIQLRRLAESELKTSEMKYRRLIEDAGAVVFTTDINGRFTFISNRVLSLTGYRKEELDGQHFSLLVAPECVENVGNHYQRQFKENISETLLEFPIITKEKTRKWVEQTGVVQYNDEGAIKGLQCIVKDIDAKKHIQLELEKSENKRKENRYQLESILNNSTSLIFIKDLQGRYLLVNKKFESVFNTTNDQVIGKTDYETRPEEVADRHTAVDQWVFENKKPKEVEEIIEHPDGAHHYLIIKFPLFDNKDRIYGLCGIATDISERILYEQELIKARKIAEEAEKSQEQFLANMSHEIRTPLNAIIGMTGLLAGSPLTSEQQEFASGIKESANTLLVLVNDILDFSKIKAGKLTIEEINFDLADQVSKTIYTLKHKANEKGLLFSTKIDKSIPDLVRGDPHRLSQVLINLIDNAIKFTGKGAINLYARLLKTDREKVWIRFSVEDTGIGIPEDKLVTIFDSFSQSGTDTARRYGGTGLGLTITRQLIELQGGSIGVESVLHKGSTFHFSIPYACPSGGDKKITRNMIPSGNYELPDTLKGFHLLVAEDNLINQKVIRFTLQKAGIEAEIVNNGRELIESFQSGRKYDLILSDIMMPEMDGYQAAAFIRQVLKSDIPILGMTATILQEEGKAGTGITDYISKPFSIPELIEKITLHVVRQPADNASGAVFPPVDDTWPLYDLSLLREVDDNEYMKDIFDIFLTSTPHLLQELKESIKLQQWEAVYQKSHRLKSSVGMFKMQELLDIITRIETNSGEKERLNEMTGLIEKGLALYNKIHPLLEEEKNKL